MNIRTVRIIAAKELRDMLRDRRTLFVMVVLPLLLYPLIMVAAMQIAVVQIGRIEKKQSRVVVVGREHAPKLAGMLDTLSGIQISDSGGWRERIVNNTAEAALIIPAGFADSVALGRIPDVSLYYNSSKEVSKKAQERLTDVLRQYRESVVAARLTALNADSTLLKPFLIQTENLASAQQRQGDMIGKVLGYMLVLMTLMGAFYPAVDLTSGEKERGTMETLLVSPASRAEIVYGKFVTVFLISVISALLNLLSMVGTFFWTLQVLPGLSKALPALSISPWTVLAILLLIIPLAVIFGACFLAIAVTARNYKEGTSLLSPLAIVAVFPAMMSMMPGMEMSTTMALIPITNVSLLIKEIMMGKYLWKEMLIAFASSSALAYAALRWAVNQFNQESVMFRHADELRWNPFRRPAGAKPDPLPTAGSALVLVALELIALSAMSGLALKWSVPQTVVISQAAVLLLPLFLVWNGGHDPRRVYALRLPRAQAWPATLVLIAGGWLLSIELATLQNAFLPFPKEMLEKFEYFFRSLNVMPLAAALSFVALIPGVCEELLCRGYLLHAFRTRLTARGAIVLTALAFGLLHLDPYRLLSTVFLGILLGYIVLYTGSIFPAMLAHATNNALSFLVQRNESLLTGIKWLKLDESQFLPIPLVVLAVALISAGLWWLKRSGGSQAPSTMVNSSNSATDAP